MYFCGNVQSSVWDVEVSNDEDEAGCHDGGRVVIELLGNVMAQALARMSSSASNCSVSSFSFLK